MIRKLIFLLLLCTIAVSAMSQQTHQKVVWEINYLLYLPENYNQDTAKRFPLMLFLHGSGERGTGLERVKVAGLPMMIEKGKKFPFIVISPQAGQNGWEENDLYQMLISIKKKYRVDNKRIYLTGLSMGGYGTWSLAIKHPEEFAAIVPICGGGDTTNIFKLRHMAVWAFHGAKDDIVPSSQSINMVNALKKYNPSAKLTIYPEANHFSWDATYNNDSLYTWLLQQTKFAHKQVNIKQHLLDSYAGTYVGANKDTIKIIAEKGSLMAKPRPNHTVELKAASDNLFFVREDYPADVEFVKRGKNEFFILTDDKRVEFRKVGK